MEIKYWECLRWFYRRYPDHIKEYIESVSPKQTECKKWLVDELLKIPNNFNNIQLYGGWLGYPLIDILDKEYEIKTLHNFDCDPKAVKACNKFSKAYFKHDYVKAYCKKIEDVHQDFSNVDLVINTSSEHMPHLPELVKNKKYKTTCIFALQSNNMFGLEEHINCVNSEDELIEKSKLAHVLYSGKKGFDYVKNGSMEHYERYMVIGLRDMWIG